MEIRNVPADVVAQILKLQSVSLCANLTGQMTTYCLVNPPKPGQPSYPLFAKERDGILDELKQRAVILAEGLNRIPGIQCNKVAGAMYCFPSVTLPPGPQRRRLLHEPPGGDRHLRGARIGLRPGPGHRPLPHHHPAAHAQDEAGGGKARRLPRSLQVAGPREPAQGTIP